MEMQQQPDGTYLVEGFKFGSAEEAASFIQRNAPTHEAVAAPVGGSMPVWPWLVVGTIVMLYLVIRAADTPEAREKASARAVIEECWKEHDKWRYDPGPAGIVSGACKMLEEKFRAKYNVTP